ncbi:MAG: NADH-quinone oxidoreductase subunit NuoG [Acidobacteriales bacterium]|nr:NADH-quinone oxidoreductase subunit NuoG [Terriglobales bacterium]
MANLVHLTIDDKAVEVPAGTLVIEAAKTVGIRIPAFCYYPGLTLQAACRMCLVEVEKAPKLQTSCTLPVAEGMVVRTSTPQVVEARKSMLEFLLTNHPLDCPVCDKGGECELQDMTYEYGAGTSRFHEEKVHTPETRFSPFIYYDAPRCILCYRCVRICNEGMGVNALSIVNRGAVSEIAPNQGDHLECDECGMCIDICPVGALTSETYRYHTRPWEMQHIGTVCAHCADGCKTTLGVRNGAIIRANNRDRSGANGEFLCVKGRFAFDYNSHAERLQSPLMKVNGKLEPVSWARAIEAVAAKFRETVSRRGGFGVIGSNRTTNEEDYYLQKFARRVLETSNIDHHRTGDVPALMAAVGGRADAFASTADLYTSRAVLVAANDLAQQHPFLSYQIRANWRHHQAHVYAVTRGPVREDGYATSIVRTEKGKELEGIESLRDKLQTEPELVIVFGDAIQDDKVRALVSFGDSLGIPVKYVCLVDYANSRGAIDMGLAPEFEPGYVPASQPGLSLKEMLDGKELDALWVVGANPLSRQSMASSKAFVVVQDLFLTETAARADVVLPALSAYEKTGTMTNVCGEQQPLARGAVTMGAKSDLEIFGLLGHAMEADLGPATPAAVLAEIRREVPGYNGTPVTPGASLPRAGEVWSSEDTLFSSGTLGRYSKMLNSATERSRRLYQP